MVGELARGTAPCPGIPRSTPFRRPFPGTAHGLDQPRVVLVRTIHSGAHPPRRERSGRSRVEKAKCAGDVGRAIQPTVTVAPCDHRRHPIMDGSNLFVGVCRDDGEGVKGLRVGPAPGGPDAGEGDHLSRVGVEPVRHLPSILARPFVEAVRGNQTAAARERLPEGSLHGHRFGARVDVATPTVLPRRNEAPRQQADPASAAVLGNDRRPLARRDVVSRLMLKRQLRSVEASRSASSEAASVYRPHTSVRSTSQRRSGRSQRRSIERGSSWAR